MHIHFHSQPFMWALTLHYHSETKKNIDRLVWFFSEVSHFWLTISVGSVKIEQMGESKVKTQLSLHQTPPSNAHVINGNAISSERSFCTSTFDLCLGPDRGRREFLTRIMGLGQIYPGKLWFKEFSIDVSASVHWEQTLVVSASFKTNKGLLSYQDNSGSQVLWAPFWGLNIFSVNQPTKTF